MYQPSGSSNPFPSLVGFDRQASPVSLLGQTIFSTRNFAASVSSICPSGSGEYSVPFTAAALMAIPSTNTSSGNNSAGSHAFKSIVQVCAPLDYARRRSPEDSPHSRRLKDAAVRRPRSARGRDNGASACTRPSHRSWSARCPVSLSRDPCLLRGLAAPRPATAPPGAAAIASNATAATNSTAPLCNRPKLIMRVTGHSETVPWQSRRLPRPDGPNEPSSLRETCIRAVPPQRPRSAGNHSNGCLPKYQPEG